MSTIEPEVSPQSSKREPPQFSKVVLLTTKRLFRWCGLTAIALILLLLPALFVKQPLLPQRQLSKRVSNGELPSRTTLGNRTTPAISEKTSTLSPWNFPMLTDSKMYVDPQLSISQYSPQTEGEAMTENRESMPERAQFSFARFAQTVPMNSNNLQMGGITVSGPILSGRALARDSQGRLVQTLSQPNLLLAGRGYIPSTSAGSSGGSTSSVVDNGVRARTTSEREPPNPETNEEPEPQLVKESFGIFNFSTDQFGNSTVTRTRSGVSEIVASRKKLGENGERTVFSGRSAPATWNEFVGELFLIIVSPSLVGEGTIEGFQLQKIDEGNHLQLLALRNGDSIRLLNGEPITSLTIEALPDLLLERQAEITVRRKEGRDTTTFVTVD